jgi:hypothetical protein
LDDEQRFAMEEWLGRLEAVVIQHQDRLSAEELERVVRLVDHGEPAEGLLALAWILHRTQDQTPATDRRRIRDLAGDLVPDDLWPPGWWTKPADAS